MFSFYIGSRISIRKLRMKYLIEEFIGLDRIRVVIWLNEPRKWVSTIYYYIQPTLTITHIEYHGTDHHKIKEEFPYLYDEEAILGKSFNEVRDLLNTYSIIYE